MDKIVTYNEKCIYYKNLKLRISWLNWGQSSAFWPKWDPLVKKGCVLVKFVMSCWNLKILMYKATMSNWLTWMMQEMKRKEIYHGKEKWPVILPHDGMGSCSCSIFFILLHAIIPFQVRIPTCSRYQKILFFSWRSKQEPFFYNRKHNLVESWCKIIEKLWQIIWWLNMAIIFYE